jgi:AcrR family transcriptional regulator
MDAAEELFSTCGVEGVSIRSVEAAAGLAPAAVHYHFRSKDRLLTAVVLRRGKAVARRAGELLDTLAAEKTTPPTQEVVEALATPYLELLQRDPVGGLRWARLMARLVLAQDPRLRRLNAGPDGLEQRFWRFVRRAFPGVPEQLLETAWSISFNILMLMLGKSDTWAVSPGAQDKGQISKTAVDTLVEFVASGFAVVMAAKSAAPARQCGRAATARGARR